MEECGICGLEMKDKFPYQLSCNHEFHYECLMKSFQNTIKIKKESNHCPYCRNKAEYLPLVNGLRKVLPGVHCNNQIISINETKNILKKDYSVRCQHELKRGKNKGNNCNKNCILGYTYCKTHLKKFDQLNNPVI